MDNVSVLIPTYNRAKLIRQCITSVLLQDYKYIDIIVYDDGSTDDTNRVVSCINDDRIRFIYNKKNNGIVHARNELLNAAKSKIACWQDSDDLSNVRRISRQLQTIKNGDKLVYSGFTTFTNNADIKRIPEKTINSANASAMFLIEHAPEFREIIRGPGPTTLGGEDEDWKARFLKNTNIDIITIPQALYYVRKHRDRMGVWRRDPSANKDWHERMKKRINPPLVE